VSRYGHQRLAALKQQLDCKFIEWLPRIQQQK